MKNTVDAKPRDHGNLFRACLNAFKKGFRRSWEMACRRRHKVLLKKYKKAYPGEVKDELDLINRLFWLMSGCKPGKTAIFTGIEEDEIG